MLVHWKNGAWESVPVTVDTVNHTITGTLTSLSPFALAEPVTVDRSTKTVLTKTIAPSAYGKPAGIVARLTDVSGAPLPGRTLFLEVRKNDGMWSKVATMAAVPGKPGTYSASLKSYAASGRTYVRVRSVGDEINDGSASAAWSFLPKARLTFTAKVARRVVVVSGVIVPKHTSATTVKMVAQKIVRGRVVSTRVLTVKLAAKRTAFAGKLVLTSGTWRINVTHADATHAASAGAPRTVRVL
jgi:hypothetical protein